VIASWHWLFVPKVMVSPLATLPNSIVSPLLTVPVIAAEIVTQVIEGDDEQVE
jgi:hypothetical protein